MAKNAHVATIIKKTGRNRGIPLAASALVFGVSQGFIALIEALRPIFFLSASAPPLLSPATLAADMPPQTQRLTGYHFLLHHNRLCQLVATSMVALSR